MEILIRKLVHAVGLFVSLSAMPALAQAPIIEDGYYGVNDGSYSIEIVKDGEKIVVIEPNKESDYTPAGGNEYEYTSNTTGTHFGLKILSQRSVEAFKYPAKANPTRLDWLRPSSHSKGVSTRPVDTYGDLAKKYQQLAISNPEDVQTWAACAAAALKRSQASAEDAEAYGVRVAQSLKLIIIDQNSNPCPDAITPEAWKAASIESYTTDAKESTGLEASPGARAQKVLEARKQEAGRQERAERAATAAENEKQRLIAEADVARNKAAIAKVAADQAAFEQEQQRYREAKALNDAEVAKAKAAMEEYQRLQAEYNRKAGRR